MTDRIERAAQAMIDLLDSQQGIYIAQTDDDLSGVIVDGWIDFRELAEACVAEYERA